MGISFSFSLSSSLLLLLLLSLVFITQNNTFRNNRSGNQSIKSINQISTHPFIDQSLFQSNPNQNIKNKNKNVLFFICLSTGPPHPPPPQQLFWAALLCPLQLLWHCPRGSISLFLSNFWIFTLIFIFPTLTLMCGCFNVSTNLTFVKINYSQKHIIQLFMLLHYCVLHSQSYLRFPDLFFRVTNYGKYEFYQSNIQLWKYMIHYPRSCFSKMTNLLYRQGKYEFCQSNLQ